MMVPMFRTIADFLGCWEHESAATAGLFDTLTEASLGQSVGPRYRTLARIAWHITQTLPEMMGRTGLRVEGVDEHAAVPAHAAEIRSAYVAASASLARRLKAEWTDATLDREDDMYGSMWKRGATLFSLVTHQAHHRGQMTVLMRQAGLRVKGIYGPALEDWSTMGMEPPPV